MAEPSLQPWGLHSRRGSSQPSTRPLRLVTWQSLLSRGADPLHAEHASACRIVVLSLALTAQTLTEVVDMLTLMKLRAERATSRKDV